MKKVILSYLFCGLLISPAFISCKDDPADIDKDSDDTEIENPDNVIVEGNKYVNQWIYDNMSTYYYWNENLPSKPNYTSSPEDFFNSICYKYDKIARPDGDRFSWIQENYVDLLNMLSGVSSDELGFELQLYYADEKKHDLIGEILYVKKNTPAQAQGLKRGQFFTHINGQKLTIDNYNQSLSLSGNYTITIVDINKNEDEPTEYINERTLNLSTLSIYNENPIYLDSIYPEGNKKIGYLVYHFFAGDPGDGSLCYDKQLGDLFNKFKQNNITDLILDLRYNSGGSIASSIYLASMITKNFSTANIFAKIKYNRSSGYKYDYPFENTITDANGKKLATLPNIGNQLQNFYVLTGKHTASASEMIINGLKPYMGVTLLGDTTVGKNVASRSFYKTNDAKNKWGIQPIIAKIYNKNDESSYTAGFIPDNLNTDKVYPKKEFGDKDENMLKEAIDLIVGNPVLKSGNIRQFKLNSVKSSIGNKPWSNQIILERNLLNE